MKTTNITPAMLKAAFKGRDLLAGTPEAIIASEKAGQTELVSSTNMPKELYPNQEAFEKVGFKFGQEIDDIFTKAELPQGWTREATNHDMHSYILDEKKRKRVLVFYKAAFYDRRANAELERRYSVGTNYLNLVNDRPVEVAIFDQDKPIETFPFEQTETVDYTTRRRVDNIAAQRFKQLYPNGDDPTAYWDDET
jgi:hypothetical protein